jgi:hypothetical protein
MDAKVDDVLEEKINPAKGKCQKSMSWILTMCYDRTDQFIFCKYFFVSTISRVRCCSSVFSFHMGHDEKWLNIVIFVVLINRSIFVIDLKNLLREVMACIRSWVFPIALL